ncbi:MAG: DUF4412 domain-containing protein [Balneolales bacterium]
MKNLFLLIFKTAPALLLLLLFAASGLTQQLRAQQFEGTLTYELDTPDEVQSMTYHMKDNKARVEIAVDELGGNAVILIDSDTENMTILMEQLSMYMQIPVPPEEENGQEVQADDFQLTGQKRTIAGIDCQEYIYTDENGHKTEIWTPEADDFGGFLFPGMGEDDSMANMPDFNFFPFLVVSNAGGESMRMEVVSIEGKSLQDELFTVPSGFREMNMPFGN